MTTTTNSPTAPRNDVYTRVTNRIVEDLERGVRPWHQPWNAQHVGSITRPLGGIAADRTDTASNLVGEQRGRLFD